MSSHKMYRILKVSDVEAEVSACVIVVRKISFVLRHVHTFHKLCTSANNN